MTGLAELLRWGLRTMPNEDKGQVGIGSAKFEWDTLVGFVGFGLLVASFLGLLVIAPPIVTESDTVFFLRLGSMAVLAVTFLVAKVASYLVTRSSCRILTIVALAGPLAVGAFFLVPGVTSMISALMIAGAVASLGLGTLSLLWFCFLCTRSHQVLPIFISSAIVMGVVICLAETYLIVEAACVVIVLVWILSLMCIYTLIRLRPTSVFPVPIENRDSDRRSKILWTSALMLSISNFEFGFVIGTVRENADQALCLGAAALVSAALAISFAGKKSVSERSISPLTTPITVLGFLALYLFGETAHVIALCILTSLFTVYSVFGTAAMVEHVRISRLAVLRTYGKARFLDYLGMMTGLVTGFVVAQLAVSDLLHAAQITVGIAIVYGFVAVHCHKARFPERSMEETGRTLPETKGQWKKRCRVVSEQSGLSDRQFEVLILVSQGRNAKYIEQALSISLSTAQTHIRNIYRKTGVHSRQELLNLIEDTKLYGEE